MLRVPETHAPLDDVLVLLEKLPKKSSSATSKAPLLEVRILLEKANPRIRQQIEAALETAHVHLLKIDVKKANIEAQSTEISQNLDEISPEDVFRSICLRSRGYEPSSELNNAFSELLNQVYLGENS